ncbi:MAG: cereblon family protein [Pseudomonadota bacterium]
MSTKTLDEETTLDPALESVLGEVLEDDEPAPQPYVYCARCNAAVADQRAAIAVNGKHRHFCVNPHGFEFDLGCYREALGCAISGQPTHADSWFAGYFWRYANCAECEQHLGWYFERGDGYFYGLVRDRIRNAAPDS